MLCLGDNSQEDPNPEALTKKTKETKGDQSQEDPNQEALTKKNKTKGDQRHEDPNPKALTNKNKKKQVSDRKGLANVVGMVGTILYETLTKKTKKQTNLIQNGPSHPDYIGQPLSVWNLFFCFFGQCFQVWVFLALVTFGLFGFFGQCLWVWILLALVSFGLFGVFLVYASFCLKHCCCFFGQCLQVWVFLALVFFGLFGFCWSMPLSQWMPRSFLYSYRIQLL